MSKEDFSSREFPQLFLKFFQDKLQEAKEDMELAEKLAADIGKHGPRIFEHYGKQIADWSLEMWMHNYALAMHKSIRKKEFYQSFGENLKGAYIKEATACFWQIQQRKLFNMQCLFRAGKIKIPQIGTVHEFHYWERNIANCPFLPPVTQSELDLYLQYLQSEYCSIEGLADFFSWQSYDQYKEMYDDGSDYDQDDPEAKMDAIPPWYVFYDIHMGTSELLTYPDLRGEKESEYRALARQHKKKQDAENGIAPPDYGPYEPPLPYMDFHSKESLLAFSEQYDSFENRVMLENMLHVDFMFYDDPDGLCDKADSAYQLVLQVTNEPWPIEWNSDWRMGLIKAAHKYKIKKITETLPLVYAEYIMRLELGISSEDEFNPLDQSFQNTREEILLGRELMGEPRDFDF